MPNLKRRAHVIDDEPEIREGLALLLSTAQIATTGHASAEAYLASPAGSGPSCLIVDNRLPGLSGLQLLKRLKDEGSALPVILITGHGDVPTAVAAMKLGAFHFFEKPFDGESLLTAVEEALTKTEDAQDEIALAEAFRARRDTLSHRESEVFDLLLEGLPTKSIAERLAITARTAEHHRAAVMRKLEAKSISHLMRMTLRHQQPSETNQSKIR